jgi:zinc transport system permease protein
MAILEYDFMRRAFIVGIFLAVVVPCVGIVVVLKRLSMIGDAFSHASLAGVAAGLIMGINPVLGAGAACVAAALGIEAIRKKLPKYSEMSIAIIMSASVGLAGVLSGLVKNAANFNSFLFGSIVAISDFEMYLVVCVSLAVTVAFVILYKELFYIALDERAARVAGVPVGAVNFVFTILTAVTVSVAARTVGALIVSAMMVVPVACAMQFGKSYKRTVLFAICFALAFTVAGLFLAYYARLKPGGTIVLTGVLCFVLILLGKKLAASAAAASARRAGRDVRARG